MANDLAKRDPSGLAIKLMELCPGITEPMKMLQLVAEAHSAYVYGECTSARDLARKFENIPLEAFQYLVKSLDWPRQRAAYLDEVRTASEVKYAEFLEKTRAAVASEMAEQLRPTIKAMNEKLSAALLSDDKYSTTDSRRLAEALSMLMDKLLQVVGVDGAPPKPADAAKVLQPDKPVKQPFVTVNATGPVSVSAGEKEPDEQPL